MDKIDHNPDINLIQKPVKLLIFLAQIRFQYKRAFGGFCALENLQLKFVEKCYCLHQISLKIQRKTYSSILSHILSNYHFAYSFAEKNNLMKFLNNLAAKKGVRISKV